MQVYKAWSVAFARGCVGEAAPPPQAPSVVTLPPVTLVVRRRRPKPKPCPLRPVPEPPRHPSTPSEQRGAAVSGKPAAEAYVPLTVWLRHAVTLAIAGRHMGVEGTASLLAGRLDRRQAAALACLAEAGQLDASIAMALRSAGLSERPDVPLKRIINSALRRYELRPWLGTLR